MLAQATNTITLRGSTDIVVQFFDDAVNSILYQRGIYQPEDFGKESKYGIMVYKTTDQVLQGYISNVMKQLESWLMEGNVQKLVLVVKSNETGDTLERWVFDCQATVPDKENIRSVCHNLMHIVLYLTIFLKIKTSFFSEYRAHKSEKDIAKEIQAIIRQITSSVTFLPQIEPEQCAFDLLVYADKDTPVPVTWEDTDPCYIANAEDVRLRSFSTKVIYIRYQPYIKITLQTLVDS